MKSAEIHLPYFKQGDDLGHHLEECETIPEALEAHAQDLECAVDILRKVKEMVADQKVTMDADTHMIMISGEDSLIDKLIEADLASETEDFDEEDDEDFEDEDEEDDEEEDE